ncbi:unnamed protein product [Anisakis simplex]|uniref:Uncharacterized protein n=1 Tax=Anisakis simplex TaxID=6269 RepID=A0A3P6NYX7_ANISI|nr:unnamed protein product [Anisakis simplex]
MKRYAGWEHLNEPPHVFVIAFDKDLKSCELKLNAGVQAITAIINKASTDFKDSKENP